MAVANIRCPKCRNARTKNNPIRRSASLTLNFMHGNRSEYFRFWMMSFIQFVAVAEYDRFQCNAVNRRCVSQFHTKCYSFHSLHCIFSRLATNKTKSIPNAWHRFDIVHTNKSISFSAHWLHDVAIVMRHQPANRSQFHAGKESILYLKLIYARMAAAKCTYSLIDN